MNRGQSAGEVTWKMERKRDQDEKIGKVKGHERRQKETGNV